MRSLFAGLLLLVGSALYISDADAQTLVYCDVSIAAFCNQSTNPGNGAQGDPAWQAFGKLNANFTFLTALWSLPANSLVGSQASGTLGAITIGTNLTLSGGVLSATGGGGGGSGTVTSASVVTANGFAGSVATATTTPAITLSTTVTGPLKGNGTAIQAAAASDLYGVFGCSGVATTFLNGAGGCTTPAGGGNVTAGSAAQYQIGVFTSGTGLQGIAPSSTSGEALISSGSSAYPQFSASLPGVTSVNNTAIPSTATLLYAGGPLGTPSSGVGTNLTGTATALNIGGTAALATSLAGGLVDQIPYQTAANTTAFITAPGSANIFLEWTGSAFVWASPTGSGTVSSGAIGNFAGYNATGTTVSQTTPQAAQGLLNTIAPNTQSGTTYTFGATDANGITPFTSSSAVTATIAAHTTYNFPVGTELTIVQSGTGIVTPTAGSGVTLCVSGIFACTISNWPTYGTADVQVWKEMSLDTWYLISESPCGGQSTCTLGGHGVLALPTSSIASGACVNTQVFNYYINNPNHVTINWSFDSDPTSVTGYFPASSGSGHLELYVFATSQYENFKLCNWTASAIVPGPMSIDQSVRIP